MGRPKHKLATIPLVKNGLCGKKVFVRDCFYSYLSCMKWVRTLASYSGFTIPFRFPISMHFSSQALFLYRIGILVIGFCHASPFSVHFHQQKVIGKINASSPFFFQHTDNGEGFLHIHYIYACLEVLTCTDRVYISVELPILPCSRLPSK